MIAFVFKSGKKFEILLSWPMGHIFKRLLRSPERIHSVLLRWLGLIFK